MDKIYITLHYKNIVNARTKEVIRECRNDKEAELVADAMVRRGDAEWPTMDQVVQFMEERGEKPAMRFTIKV